MMYDLCLNKPKQFEYVLLEDFPKTDLEKELDDVFGYKERTVYEDIESTYLKYIAQYGHLNIKIKTNKIPPMIYKFMTYEIEIIEL